MADTTTQLIRTTCITFLLVAGASCGPVNEKTPDPIDPNASTGLTGAGNPSSPDNSAPVLLSKNQAFVVSARVKGPQASAAATASDAHLPAAHAQVGENEYVIRFVHSADLLEPSKDAQVVVHYRRLKARVPQNYLAPVERQADGTYLAKFNFKKPGKWEIHIELTDGAVKDEHTIHVKI